MSSKKPPPPDVDEGEYNHDEAADGDEDDEDEDEDEAEFIPGINDDDDDEEEEEEEEDAVGSLLDGVLSIDAEKKLHYRGEGFHLTSTKPVEMNLLVDSDSITSLYSVVMEGPCRIASRNEKQTHRTMELSWSVQYVRQASLMSQKTGSDEETKDSKIPPVYYSVYGRQLDSTTGETLELRGGYSPSQQGSETSLVCQARFVTNPSLNAAAAIPSVAMASARVNDDVDEDEDEADDEVDYDELIALHEDAGLSVEDLKRKYHSGSTSPSKKGKAEPEDDDEDYGF